MSVEDLTGSTTKNRSPSNYALSEITPAIKEQEEVLERVQQANIAQTAFGMLTGDFDSLSNAAWKPREKEIENAKTRLYRLHTEPWRRWANGFSCLCFVLVGIPVSIRMRFSEFIASFFICFLPILLVYYPLLAVSVDKAKDGLFPPQAVWLGNIVLASRASGSCAAGIGIKRLQGLGSRFSSRFASFGLRCVPDSASPATPSVRLLCMLAACRSAFRNFRRRHYTSAPILCPPRDIGFARDIFALANSKQAATRARTARSLGADAVRQRLLRPLCLSRFGEKPERAVRPSCRWPISCAIAWPRLHEILSQVEDQQRFDELASRRTGDEQFGRPNRLGRRRHLATEMSKSIRFVLPDARAVPGHSSIPIDCTPIRASATTRTSAIRWQKSTIFWPRLISDDIEDPSGWRLDNEHKVSQLRKDVESLRERSAELPSHLLERLRELASDVRNEYRWAISLAWGTADPHDDPADLRPCSYSVNGSPGRWRRSLKVRGKSRPATLTTAFISKPKTKCASWPSR